MARKILGIGDWAVSADPSDYIETYALGSCVAVIIYDVRVNAAGMIHIALPDSAINPEKAGVCPGYFADTGLPLMIRAMSELNAARSTVWVRLIGGASVLDTCLSFDIGKRNIAAIKRILWRSSIGVAAEDTGGNISRTVSIAVDSGEVTVTSQGKKWRI